MHVLCLIGGMVTMRERLIELIANEPNSVDSIVSHADYLLANGVICRLVRWVIRCIRYVMVAGYMKVQ